MTETEEALIYCLEQNLPHAVIAALLPMVDDDDRDLLADAWRVWSCEEYGLDRDRDGFAAAVAAIAGYDVIACGDCREWTREEEATETTHGEQVCESCREEYSYCYGCDLAVYCDDAHYVEDGDYIFCEPCLHSHCHYCDVCEEWSRHEHDECGEEDGCDCDAPHRRFSFLANGEGTIANDTRLDVTLPAGTIDAVGLDRIRGLLFTEHGYDVVTQSMDATGDVWQGKRGNYTRRLSREMHTRGAKLSAGMLSEIGNLARQHSSDTSTWAIEFTRNLNLPAYDFAHGDSCWWQSYAESRCALKQWGGIGLRTFDQYGNVDGRAWVQPLDAGMRPTHDALGAHAFVIYNAYGKLSGYQAARIVAHLTSRTYRKVELRSDPQYINNDAGYLVADESTCEDNNNIHLSGDAHQTFDASTITREVVAA